MTEMTDEADPLAGFAALMAGARPEAEGEPDPAPWGYTRDEATGEMRPKKSPGRPRRSPSLDDLKAQREAANPEAQEAGPAEDRAPAALKGRGGRRHRPSTPKPAPPVPQKFRAEGSIAKGVNQLYRKVGKLVRVMDPDVGQALIGITRAEDPEDVTVGDAWEELARGNPRVRAFLLRILVGGAVSQLVACHLPVLGAVLMKDSIRRRIPFGGLVTAFVDDSDGVEESPAAGTLFEGLQPEDVAQMHAMAAAMAEQVMNRGNGGVPPRGE